MDPYEKSKANTKRYLKLKKLLKMVYGYDSFRPRQYEIINRIINGEDVCAIQPTGAGKSICFQIPALYFDKPAIIITPLIALMDDQRLILEELGISSCCYNSNVQNKGQLQREILVNKYKFIYITPESATKLQDFFTKIEETVGISLIAIDEAHCISSYGFDFRKAYREITFFKELLPDVPILALTATATTIVSTDLCKVLGFNHTNIIKSSFDRPNLYIKVSKKSKNIGAEIVPIVKKTNEKSIIYCVTKKETAKIAEILKTHKIKCGMYHADLSMTEREKTHKDFINDKINVVVSTLAYGMGINVKNIRNVVHFGSPKSIESYYQEIGRAGRDGKKANCYTFYGEQDFKIQEMFIQNSNNTAYQKVQTGMLNKIKQYMRTTSCRRQLILEYFDEAAPDNCGNCDNCCGDNKTVTNQPLQTVQSVEPEVKMLIGLMESVSPRTFGVTMFIDILRGSKAKKISSVMKKSDYYGKGKHRSVDWWKEVIQNLIDQGFIQSVYLRSGGFPVAVIKVTRKGLDWVNANELGEYLSDFALADGDLKPMTMNTTV